MQKNRGLVLVFTGDGKGKTTAAVGTAMRMIKHGKRVAMVQFFKAPGRHILPRGKFRVWSFGGGFTWKTAREVNRARVAAAWKKCRALLRDPEYSLVILDEINVALGHQFLKTSDVIKALKTRTGAAISKRKMTVPGFKHVILTGRGAPPALIRFADLVTEMKCLKHPFGKGVPAQPGIDF